MGLNKPIVQRSTIEWTPDLASILIILVDILEKGPSRTPAICSRIYSVPTLADLN